MLENRAMAFVLCQLYSVRQLISVRFRFRECPDAKKAALRMPSSPSRWEDIEATIQNSAPNVH